MATEKPFSSNSQTGSSVRSVVLGDLLFKTWFQSYYPEDLVAKDTERLYVCRWCFRYSCDVNAYAKHTRLCANRTTPPGSKVYEHGGYSVWEVDGEEEKLFAQNLSLFAKLFVDHKTVFFDVASFLFYVLAFSDPNEPHNTDCHILGYFSKEKMPWDANNLACILIFPPYQHRKLGKLLISVSYKLSGWEWGSGLIGSPERPLSELGWKSYSGFWKARVLRHLLFGSHGGHPMVQQDVPAPKAASSRGYKRKYPSETMTVHEMGLAVGMLSEDVITALNNMGVVEPDQPRKKRKIPRHHPTDGSGMAIDSGDQAVKIRKSTLLEWSKTHSVSLQNPVREEGFLGKWARSKPV